MEQHLAMDEVGKGARAGGIPIAGTRPATRHWSDIRGESRDHPRIAAGLYPARR